ncbi:MAG: GlsB/YeaQ/YmgE family stress response membrane protein [Vulcanimicrobiota bacterium]
MSIMGWIFFLIVAAVCAWIASAMVPGSIPGGFLVAMVLGVAGAWIGTKLIGDFGPSLAGVAVLPAILGSAVLIFGLALISGRGRGGN